MLLLVLLGTYQLHPIFILFIVYHDSAHLKMKTSHWNMIWCKSVKEFCKYVFCRVQTLLRGFKLIICSWAACHTPEPGINVLIDTQRCFNKMICRLSVQQLKRYGFCWGLDGCTGRSMASLRDRDNFTATLPPTLQQKTTILFNVNTCTFWGNNSQVD